MQKNLLELLYKKNHIAYIIFDTNFFIVDAKNVSVEKGSDLRDFLWEIVGLEEYILKLPASKKSIEIPMLLRDGDYYDLNIEHFVINNHQKSLFIVSIQQQAKQTHEYAHVIKESNKKNLLHDIKTNRQTNSFHVDIDTLTGLANRQYLLKAIDKTIKSSNSFCICFIDIDNFHTINEEYGSHAGDMLLKHLTARLESLKGDEDLLARVESDTFALLFDPQKNKAAIQTFLTATLELQKHALNYTSEDIIEFTFTTLLLYHPDDAKNAQEFLLLEKNKMNKMKIDKRSSC